MIQLAHLPVSRDLRALFGPLFESAEHCQELTGTMAGAFFSQGRRHGIPRFLFEGPRAEQDPIRLGLFAGVHGDEPAGCAALVDLLCDLVHNPAKATGYDLVVYPVCNPTGFEDSTRANRSGLDLNREFWRGSSQPEIIILENELRAHRFDGIITLHADDTSDGLYGYAHGRVLNEALLKPALCASEQVLPRNRSGVIDGFEAEEGVIHRCFGGVLSAPREQRPQPFDLIFETPARAPHDLQVLACVAALETIFGEYRGFIAHAQYL
ncbi:MAG TPA: M14 family metallocarboxypeptidase [Rariglobus sp.]|jgi:hypothetical protein|nr:M14 family metallocarboxypeptidase [Rariglobus sp.]